MSLVRESPVSPVKTYVCGSSCYCGYCRILASSTIYNERCSFGGIESEADDHAFRRRRMMNSIPVFVISCLEITTRCVMYCIIYCYR